MRAGSLLRVLALSLFVGGMGVLPASAKVDVSVDLSAQMMTVMVNGGHYATWRVSTGVKGFRTPLGRYRPRTLKRMHYSTQYNNTPMPHSIFFRAGFAIHGTEHVKELGRPASHGCIRLSLRNAAKLYGLVRAYGKQATRIVIMR